VATLSQDPKPGDLRIRYRLRNGQVWLGTNAYFFEEGKADRYQGARYGEFRIDRDSGEAVLVALADENLKRSRRGDGPGPCNPIAAGSSQWAGPVPVFTLIYRMPPFDLHGFRQRTP
jgi:hypothetical protein